MKVKISKTHNPEDGPYKDKDDLLCDVMIHRKHVSDVMNKLSYKLMDIGFHHDWTKIQYLDDFYRDTCERPREGDSIDLFKSRSWYNLHVTREQHHLNANCPVDVDLFNVLEFIVDCVCAGKSRSGFVNYGFLELDRDDLLEIAFWNTVRYIEELVELED